MLKDVEIKDMNTFRQMKPLDAIVYLYRAISKYEPSFKKETLLNLASDIPKLNLDKLEETIDSISKSEITEPEFLNIIRTFQFKTANIYSIYERFLKKYELITHVPRLNIQEALKPGDKFSKVFDRFDVDKTGYIVLTDFLKYFQTKKIDIQHIPRKDLSNAFAKMEPDKSKGVSKEKFINYVSGNCSRPFAELVNRVAELEGMNRIDFGISSPRGSETRKSMRMDSQYFFDRDELYGDRAKEIEALLNQLRNQLEIKLKELQFLIDTLKGSPDFHRSQSMNNLDLSGRRSLDPQTRQNIENQENLKTEISDIQSRINQLMNEANEIRLLNQNFSFNLNDYQADSKGSLDEMIKYDYENKKGEVEKLNQENEKLNFLLEEKEDLLKMKDEALRAKDEDLDNIKKRLSQLEAQLSREKGDVTSKSKDLDKSIETLRAIEITNYQYKINLQKTENEKKLLEDQIKELKNNYQKEHEKIQNENFELQRLLNQSTSKSDDFSREKLEASLKNQELQKIIDSLNQAIQSLQATNQDLRAHIDRYENEKKILEKEIKELKSNYHKDHEKLQTENLELQKTLNSSNSKAEDLQLQNQTLQRLKDDNDTFLRQALHDKDNIIISLKNEMQQKSLEIKRAFDEKSDIQSTLRMIQLEVETKDNHIASLEKEKNSLRHKIIEVQTETKQNQDGDKQRIERLQDELQTSQITIENLLKESLGIKNKLDAQIQKTQELEVLLTVKTKTLEENVKENTNFAKQVESEKKIVEEEISSLKKEYQHDKLKLQAENSQLHQTINRLESTIEDMKIKNQTLGLLKDEADKILKKSLEEKERQVLDLKNDLERKSIEHKVKLDEIDNLRSHFKHMQIEIETRDDKISSIQREKFSLVQKVEDIQNLSIQQKNHDNKKLEKIQNSLHNVQHVNEKLQKDIANAHTLVEKKQMVLEELENKYLVQKKYYDDMVKELKLRIEALEKELKQIEDYFTEYKQGLKNNMAKLETENSELHVQLNQIRSRVEEQNLHIQTITKSHEESELILKASLEEKEKSIVDLKNKLQTKNAAIRRANEDSNEAQIIISARESDIKYRDQVITTLDSEKNRLNHVIKDLEAKLQYFNNQEGEKVEKLQKSLQSSQATISNLQKEIIILRTNFDSSIKRNGSESKENSLEDKTNEINQIMHDSLTKFSEYKEKKEKEIQKLKIQYEERIKELEHSLNHFNDDSEFTNMNSQSVLFSLKKSNELLRIQLEDSQKLQEQLRAYSKKNEETNINLKKEIGEKNEIISTFEREFSLTPRTKFKLIEGSNFKHESELIYVKASLEQKEEEILKLKTEIGKLVLMLKGNPHHNNSHIVEPLISPRTNKLRWPGLQSDQKVSNFKV